MQGGYSMPKIRYRVTKYVSTLGEALKSFDLKVLKKWMDHYDKPLQKQFLKESEEVQMATMCRMIISRTDLLSHECHQKAVEWMREHHNMNGRMF